MKESDWHYLHKDVAHLDLPSFIDWVQDEPNFLMLDHQSYYFCKGKDGTRAIEALEKNFVHVGRTEELWDFLIAFFESQGIDSVETRSLNKTKKRLQKKEVSAAHLKKIAELYEADCMLYDHVVKHCKLAP